MKTKDELCQKVRMTPRVPRVVLKSNSQICLQDQREQDARTSYDQPSGSGKTGCNTVDYRIPGVLHSAVGTSQRQSEKVDREVREPPKQRFLFSKLQADEGDQRVQQEVAGSHR